MLSRELIFSLTHCLPGPLSLLLVGAFFAVAATLVLVSMSGRSSSSSSSLSSSPFELPILLSSLVVAAVASEVLTAAAFCDIVRRVGYVTIHKERQGTYLLVGLLALSIDEDQQRRFGSFYGS